MNRIDNLKESIENINTYEKLKDAIILSKYNASKLNIPNNSNITI